MITSFRGKYAFLSNFYERPFVYEGTVYPTAEHAFQAAKTDSQIYKEDIINARTPAEAKRLGRHVPLRTDWDLVKLNIMLYILRAKFAKSFGRQLLETDNEELVEGNIWHDNYWGSCTCFNCNGNSGSNLRQSKTYN